MTCYCSSNGYFILAGQRVPCPACRPDPREKRRQRVCAAGRARSYGNRRPDAYRAVCGAGKGM